jgi:NADPH:quinone reductase-like Zn-dependent oxidoreductase
MRAFAIDEFGQAGSIRDLPDPVPGEGEVLVEVRAAGVSTTDLAVMGGMLQDYLEHRFPLVPGIDASGVVARVGPGGDGFREGDEVCGFVQRPVMGLGSWAERVALPVGGIRRKTGFAQPRASGRHRTWRADRSGRDGCGRVRSG